MSNSRFTFEDAVAVQKQIRIAVDRDLGITVSKAFSIAEAIVNRRQGFCGREPGTYINDRNEVCPIVAPRPESEPLRKMHPVSIDSLLTVDGDVNLAETSDEVEVTADDPTELSMDTIPLRAHVDEGDVGVLPDEPEPVWQEEISEKADDGVTVECD